jgi:hypothetical protein
VTVQNTFPASIRVRLEEELTNRVPVELVHAIRAARGYVLQDPIVVFPDSVTISGPRSLVANFSAFPTEPIVEDDLEGMFERVVPLADTLGGRLRHGVEAVRVLAIAEAFTEARRVLPIVLVGAPPDRNHALDPSSVTVTYNVLLDGPDLELAQTSEDFYAFVRDQDIMADTTGLVPVQLNVPEGLRIRDSRIQPTRVRYWRVIE